MRKKPGYRQVNIYLTKEQFAQLERHWRHNTSERFISGAALGLLLEALQERLAQQNQTKPS